MNLAMNPFDIGKKPESVDEIVALQDENFKKHVEYFNNLKVQYGWNYIHKVMREAYRFEPLYPTQIHILSKTLESDVYYRPVSGQFFTWVIQNSFDAGHNNFHLNVGNHRMSFLGYYLSGDRERRLELLIDGSVGDLLGLKAQNVNFTVTGDVGNSFANVAHRCDFTLLGGARFENACYGVHWCRFKVKDKELYSWLKDNNHDVELIG